MIKEYVVSIQVDGENFIHPVHITAKSAEDLINQTIKRLEVLKEAFDYTTKPR